MRTFGDAGELWRIYPYHGRFENGAETTPKSGESPQPSDIESIEHASKSSPSEEAGQKTSLGNWSGKLQDWMLAEGWIDLTDLSGELAIGLNAALWEREAALYRTLGTALLDAGPAPTGLRYVSYAHLDLKLRQWDEAVNAMFEAEAGIAKSHGAIETSLKGLGNVFDAYDVYQIGRGVYNVATATTTAAKATAERELVEAGASFAVEKGVAVASRSGIAGSLAGLYVTWGFKDPESFTAVKTALGQGAARSIEREHPGCQKTDSCPNTWMGKR